MRSLVSEAKSSGTRVRLADGTELVRIGESRRPEHVAWRYGFRTGIAILGAATIAGCTDPRGAPNSDEAVVLVAADTLITTALELVGGVYDLAVAPNGDIYIADYGYKHVLVVAADGAVRQTIGREGSGPGEFEMPYAVEASADSMWVFDAESNLVQVFDNAGGLARSYLLDAPGVGGGRDFRDDGWLAATIGGFEDAMILVLDPSGARVADIGEPIVPPVTFYDFTALKSEIRDGRVPDAFRNQATLTWGPDRSLYLAFLAEPEARRYDATGGLIWAQSVDEPVLRSAREAFFRKNLEEPSAARIHPLRYVTDVAAVDGDLWLLLNTADENDGLLLVLDASDGTVRRRIVFPGLPNTGYFAVDEARRRLYMAPRGDASVLVFDLSIL